MFQNLPSCRAMTSGIVGLAVGALALGSIIPAESLGAPNPKTAPLHGGVVTTTGSHVFETRIAPDGVYVWFHTEDLAPAMVGKAAGTATLKLPDGNTRDLTLALRQPAEKQPTIYFCPMHAEVVQNTPGRCEPCGGMILFKQDYLFGAADLTKIDTRKVMAQIRLTGLSGREKESTFTPAFPTPDAKAAQNETGK